MYVAVLIADGEYPVRPAFSLLTKMLDDFIAKVPQSSFSTPAAISFPELNTYLQKYQDPRQADAIMKVQQELDETKIILVSLLCTALRMPDLQPRPQFDSTRPSSPYFKGERKSTILWTDPMRCRSRVRCFTRLRRRCVPVSRIYTASLTRS